MSSTITTLSAEEALRYAFNDSAKALDVNLVTATSGLTLKPVTATKVVASAGTAEAIVASSTTTPSVSVQALSSNTGAIYVGGSAVDSSTGIVLNPGDSIAIGEAQGGADLEMNEIYIDAAVNGEGVNIIYLASV